MPPSLYDLPYHMPTQAFCKPFFPAFVFFGSYSLERNTNFILGEIIMGIMLWVEREEMVVILGRGEAALRVKIALFFF